MSNYFVVWYSNNYNCYIAVSLYFPGCIADGETEQEAIDELDKVMKIWLYIYSVKEYKFFVPRLNKTSEILNKLINIFMKLLNCNYIECKNLVNNTYVYYNLVNNDEITIHEGIFINTLDIISEIKNKKNISIQYDEVIELFENEYPL